MPEARRAAAVMISVVFLLTGLVGYMFYNYVTEDRYASSSDAGIKRSARYECLQRGVPPQSCPAE